MARQAPEPAAQPSGCDRCLRRRQSLVRDLYPTCQRKLYLCDVRAMPSPGVRTWRMVSAQSVGPGGPGPIRRASIAVAINGLGKRTELLREVIPKLWRLAIMGNFGNSGPLLEARQAEMSKLT